MAILTLDPAAIRNLMIDPAGPVQRDLLRRGEAVLALARQLLARSNYTGDLEASLKVIQTGIGIAVGSDLPQVVYLHNGTGPAHITSDGGIGSVSDPRAPYFPPRNKPEFAVWATDHAWLSGYELAKHIFTHGTQPNPFLREAMVAAKT